MAAELLAKVSAGTMKAETALNAWPQEEQETSAFLGLAWHALRHFADDADLHIREPDYLLAQKCELLSWVNRLRRESETRGPRG
jgi:hypothetical protein